MSDQDTAAPAGMLSGDELTPAEQAYLDSGGENAEGLLAEQAGTKAEPEPEGKPAAEAKPAPDPKAATSETKAEPAAKAGDPDPAVDDAAADDAAHDPAKPPPTRVSYHKFRRVEERLKATEAREAELREKFARGDERLKLLAEALAPPKEGEGDPAKADPAPDPEQDIFAFVRWQGRQIDRLGKALDGTRGEIGQTRETIQQREQADELKTAYQRDAVTFAQKTPDFVHAYNHMLGTRAQMLEDQGYGADDIKGILANEERGLVQRALQANKSPAEMIYGIAQRFGYRKADATQVSDTATTEGETAAQAKPAAQTNGKPSATQIIESVKKGQEASKTLSGTGGASQGLTVEALLAMPEDEFNAMVRSKPKTVEALMGARH